MYALTDRLMNKQDNLTKQAKILRSLARESRLIIVNRLSRDECSVGDLHGLVGGDLSTVSKSLALLRAYGAVEDRRETTTAYCRLLTPCVCNLYTCATQVMKEEAIKRESAAGQFSETAAFMKGR